MKLRVRGNSVRFRLTRTELDILRDTGRIAERTEFPQSQSLTYALRVDAIGDSLSAAFAAGELSISIPTAMLERWLSPQEVGISNVLPLPGGQSLAVLIEKDFPCLTPRVGEDESDAFDRPDAEAVPHCTDDRSRS